MAHWKDLLKNADHTVTLKRARECMDKNTVYRLGKGGINPVRPLSAQSDCSGFVAWALGLPRELPPGSGKWLQTTTYWQGGGDVGNELFDPVLPQQAMAGDLLVYPDRGSRQGHIGVISEVSDGKPVKVIHCSKGNGRNGNAIQETDTSAFDKQSKSRIMRVDYSALRDLFDLPEPGDESDDVMLPRHNATLHHPVLAFDTSLQLVIKGQLVLEATRDKIGGCGAIHDALNMLALVNPAYGVDLGKDQQLRGFYGPKTSKSITQFQTDRNLPATGEIDSDTLAHIDKALLAMSSSDADFSMKTVSSEQRWRTALLAATSKGASEKTAAQDLLSAGISASQQMAKKDLKRVQSMRDKFQICAKKFDVPAALIAAIASRESRCGNVLAPDGTGDHGFGWGIMQVDKRYHSPVGERDSLEHIEQAAGLLSLYRKQVAERHPSWSDSNILKGAIVAYNSGVSNVQTIENMDTGTTGNDYSSDVIARAQFYMGSEWLA